MLIFWIVTMLQLYIILCGNGPQEAVGLEAHD